MRWTKCINLMALGLFMVWANIAPAHATHNNATRTLPIPKSAGYTPAFEKLHGQPADKNSSIIKSLNAKITDLPPPYIFELARRTFDTDPVESLTIFWLATLRAHTDAAKCTDDTVLANIRQWHKIVPRIVKAIKTHHKASQRAKLKAMDRDKAFLTETSPRWICFSGRAAARAKANDQDFIFWHNPTSEWRTLRKKTRRLMLKSSQQ